MEARLIYFGLLVMILAIKADFVVTVVFKFTNAVCASYNETVVVIPECRIRAVSRYRNTFNYFATWKESVNDMRAHVRWLKRESGYKPFLYDITLDVCQFLRKSNNPVAALIYDQFREFSSFSPKCPISGNQTIQGFYLSLEKIRLPLPTGEYLVSISWLGERKLTADTNVSFRFVEDLRP